MAYTYGTLSIWFRASRMETVMFVRAQRGWFRQAAVAAAALAVIGLLIGSTAPPSAAQAYNPGYSYPQASGPTQGSPGYSSPAPYSWGGGGWNPGWVWYPGWGWWNPAWGWPAAAWGWPGWGGWGWPGITVGWGWGGWWGGRGCWNCGFRGGFAHAGFHGGGFGGGFHGGGGFGGRR
jgi:hypothetical protein